MQREFVLLLLLLIHIVSPVYAQLIPNNVIDKLSSAPVIKIAIPATKLDFLIGAKTTSLAVMVYDGNEWIPGEIMVSPYNITFYDAFSGKLTWYLIEPENISSSDLIYITIPLIEKSIENENWSVFMAVNRIHSRALIELPTKTLESIGIRAETPFMFYIFYDKRNGYRGRILYMGNNKTKIIEAMRSYRILNGNSDILVKSLTTHRSFAVSWDYSRVLGYDRSPSDFRMEIGDPWYYFDGGGGGSNEPPPRIYWFNIPLYAYPCNNQTIMLNSETPETSTYTDIARIGPKTSYIEYKLSVKAERIEGSGNIVRLDIIFNVKASSTLANNADYQNTIIKKLYIPIDYNTHYYTFGIPNPGPIWSTNIIIQYDIVPLDNGIYEIHINDRRLIISKTDLSGTDNDIPSLEKIGYMGLVDNSTYNFWVKTINSNLYTDPVILYYAPSLNGLKLDDVPADIGFYINYLVDYAEESDYFNVYINDYLVYSVSGEELTTYNGIRQEVYIPLSQFKDRIRLFNIKQNNPVIITIKSSLFNRQGTFVEIMRAYIKFEFVPGIDPANSRLYVHAKYPICENMGSSCTYEHQIGYAGIPVYGHSGITRLNGYLISIVSGYEYYALDNAYGSSPAIISTNLLSSTIGPDGSSEIYYFSAEIWIPKDMPESGNVGRAYSYSVALSNLDGGVLDDYKYLINIGLTIFGIISSYMSGGTSLFLAMLTEGAKMLLEMDASVSVSLTDNGDYYVYKVIWNGNTEFARGVKILIAYHPTNYPLGGSVTDRKIYVGLHAVLNAGGYYYSKVEYRYPVRFRTGMFQSMDQEYASCSNPLEMYLIK